MKYTLTIFFGLLFIIQKSNAQTYCGLTYTYDAAGNRIQRAETTPCGGGDDRMLVITDSTTTHAILVYNEDCVAQAFVMPVFVLAL